MMRKKKYIVHLSNKERHELNTFVSRGKKSAREITRARILLLADEGKTDQEIMDLLGLSRPTISSLRKKYSERHDEPILDVLKDEPRSGRPVKIDTRVEANITVIACSDPPDGSAKWTLRMMADHLVKLEVIESISHESVRVALKKTS
ncbi:MAG: helix-turn-helix domain-containing protein [Acidobacteria bacterium]|nr:helix-turn-helix domain-containing protein [Acidobacteriota bacterium]